MLNTLFQNQGGLQKPELVFRCLTAVTICLMGLFSAQAASFENPRKPLRIKKDSYDFGRVMSGESIRVTFQYTNASRDRIEIAEVKPSCGCMQAPDWDGVVNAGETGKIQALLATETLEGPVRKSIKIVLKGNNPKVYRVWLTGSVWKPVSVTPAFASFGKLAVEGQVATKTLKLVSSLKGPLRLSKLTSSLPMFQATLKTIRKEKEFELTVRATTPKKFGVHKGIISLAVDHPVFHVLEIPVSAYVPPPLQITPNQLRLPKGPVDMATKMYIHIQKHTPGPLVISKFNSGALKMVTLQEIQAGKRYRIECLLPKGFMAPPKAPAPVRFKTNLKGWPDVEIAVRVPGDEGKPRSEKDKEAGTP